MLKLFCRLFGEKEEIEFRKKIKGLFKNWKFDHFHARSREEHCLWIAIIFIGFKDDSGTGGKATAPLLLGFKSWQKSLIYDELLSEIRRRTYCMAEKNRGKELNETRTEKAN